MCKESAHACTQKLCHHPFSNYIEITCNLLHNNNMLILSTLWRVCSIATESICDWILETVPNRTFGISRNTNFNIPWHCIYVRISLVLDCSHARLVPVVD